MKFNKIFNYTEIDEEAINYLFDYYPKNRGTQDKDSIDMLKFKELYSYESFNKEQREIIDKYNAYFSGIFLKKVDNYKDYIFCCVPPHHANTDNRRSIWKLTRFSWTIKELFDKDIIIRTRDIESLHSGGSRSIEVHLNSLAINKDIVGRKIIVMDDVTTSGGSLEAARTLLEKAGAKEVILFAFAKTKSLY